MSVVDVGTIESFGFGNDPIVIRKYIAGIKGGKVLDVSNFNTAKVTEMSHMFWGCHGIEKLDLSSFDLSSISENYDDYYDDEKLYSHQLLDSCLQIVITPKKIGKFAFILPENEWWEDCQGKRYLTFPKNTAESIVLTKKDKNRRG